MSLSQATIIFHAVYIVLGILAVLVNSVIVTCVFRLKYLHQNQWLILPAALLAADTVLSFGYAIVAGVTIDQHIRVKQVNNVTLPAASYTALECVTANFTLILGSVLDQIIALSIAVERVIAIGFPVSYHHNSAKIIKILIISSVFIAIPISFSSFFNIQKTNVQCSCTEGFNISYKTFYYFLMCCLCIVAVFVYAGVLILTYFQRKRLKNLCDQGMDTTIIARRIVKQLKVTKIVTMIVAAYSLTNIPAYTTICALILTVDQIISNWGIVTLTSVLLCCQLLISMNTLINSFLYIWRNPALKREIIELIRHISFVVDLQSRKRSL